MDRNDQAVRDLYYALCSLACIDLDGTYYLKYISDNFYGVSNILAKANPTLSDGWESIAGAFDKIVKAVADLVINLQERVKGFVEGTSSNESALQSAVTTANDVAEGILTDLNLN